MYYANNTNYNNIITSSINFCEPDFFIFNFIAEFFNALSSCYIALCGLYGILYKNTTNEWKIFLMYFLLFIIGIGSFLLHATLQWIPQSMDEVPMMWLNLSILYVFVCAIIKKYNLCINSFYVQLLFATFALIQTILYYCYRNIYWVFLLNFGSTLCLIIYIFIYNIINNEPFFKFKWQYPIKMFLLAGFLWIIDMIYCDLLLPYYINGLLIIPGITFHVFWHIFISHSVFNVINIISTMYYENNN